MAREVVPFAVVTGEWCIHLDQGDDSLFLVASRAFRQGVANSEMDYVTSSQSFASRSVCEASHGTMSPWTVNMKM